MRPSIRLLVLAAAVTATLAACNRDKDKAAAPAPPSNAAITPATAGAPFEFKSETPYATTSLKLPQAVRPLPELHVRLYSSAVADLKTFAEGAQADRSEAGDDPDIPGYTQDIVFDTPVETGKLFSLARTDAEFTGGAHGNVGYSGVIWDKALKRPVEGLALFRKGANLSALDTALCAAINVEKKKLDPEAAILTLGEGADMWSCPRARDIAFVLAAGSTPGKAGGLTFMVGPYVAGPYSDGSYWVNVPQSVIRSLIDPAYADEFAGDPTPLPEPA